MKLVSIVTATDGKHKYTANIKDGDGKMHKVHFGAQGYSDYTKHKDPERKRRYITRHQKSENWTKSGVLTAGFGHVGFYGIYHHFVSLLLTQNADLICNYNTTRFS